MTQEHLNQLSAALKTDSALQSQIRAATSADEVVRIANQHGCAMTLDDLKGESPSAHEGELSDADLDVVVGGVSAAAVQSRLDQQANKDKSYTDQARDRKKAGADNIQKFLDIIRGMNPQI